MGRILFVKWRCGRDSGCEVSDCVNVIVSDLTSLPDPVVDSALVSISNSEFRFLRSAGRFLL